MQGDNDDYDLSTSDARRFASESSRKLKALEQKLKKEGKETAARPLTEEKSKLKLSVLKQSMEGQKDEQTKRDRQRNEQEKSDRTSFNTKTHKQQEEAAKLDASTAQNPDMLIDQGQMAEAAKDEEQKSGEAQSNPV